MRPSDTHRRFGRRPVKGGYWAPWVDEFHDWLDALVLAYEFEQALKAEEREREQQTGASLEQSPTQAEAGTAARGDSPAPE